MRSTRPAQSARTWWSAGLPRRLSEQLLLLSSGVFVVWKGATQETETRERQLRVCSIARCYEPLFFPDVSEHRAISELVKQILFV